MAHLMGQGTIRCATYFTRLRNRSDRRSCLTKQPLLYTVVVLLVKDYLLVIKLYY